MRAAASDNAMLRLISNGSTTVPSGAFARARAQSIASKSFGSKLTHAPGSKRSTKSLLCAKLAHI